MVRVIYECGVCGQKFSSEIDALVCEISSHLEGDAPPLEQDKFYPLGKVDFLLDVKRGRSARWVERFGLLFAHMIDKRSAADLVWLTEKRPELCEDNRVRYWVPERDIYAALKALELFSGGKGGGFNTRGLGRVRVESKQGGAFIVPTSE